MSALPFVHKQRGGAGSAADDPRLDDIRNELDTLAQADLRRVVRVTEARGARTLGRDGRPLVDLASNDYLGLARDPRLADAAAEAARVEGSGAGAARLVTGTRPGHAALEAELVASFGGAAALVTASGFAANLAVLGALLGPDDLVASDIRNHASLIDGLRLAGATRRLVDARDPAQVQKALADRHRFRRAAIVVEGLHGLDGDLLPLAPLREIAETAQAFLVVDEAHAFGVVGPDGGGACRAAGLSPTDPALVRTGTLGKALGAQGAFVLGAQEVVDLVTQRGRAFVFSTALAPTAVGAARAGLRVAGAEPWRRLRCLDLAARLAEGVPARPPTATRPAGGILSVELGAPRAALAAAERLAAEHGVLAIALRPPTVPAGSSRLRLTVGSDLSDDGLDASVRALREVLG
ncbi:MAG: aminotransferase class I/II-fold pyridoxal phosphate-dependent enzyme [Planctomycetota bacterium]